LGQDERDRGATVPTAVIINNGVLTLLVRKKVGEGEKQTLEGNIRQKKQKKSRHPDSGGKYGR